MKKTLAEPKLDPVLPLPFGTGIPEIKQGDGKAILADTSPKAIDLSYRAFYTLWEHAERRAAVEYPKYVGGPLDNVAQMWVEMVAAFRSAGTGVDILPISERKAARIRAKELEEAKRKPCKHENTTRKRAKDGTRYLKCLKCGEKLPREGSTSPSKSLKASSGTKDTPRRRPGAQKATQKPVSRRKKAKK